MLVFGCDGQSAPPALKFEVASVKPSLPPGQALLIAGILGGPGTQTPELVRAWNCSLLNFINRAFNLTDDSHISGPAWLRDAKFDITARVPDGTTTQQQISLMLQDMLAERFGLKFHYETREVSGFSLVVARSGSKLKASAKAADESDSPSSPSVPPGTMDRNGFPAINPTGPQHRGARGANHDRWPGQTMGQFVSSLSGELNHPVIDMTGLKGEYDIELYWVNECPRRPDCDTGVELPGVPTTPMLASALEEQLGLKLVSVAKVPTQILVVDHIEKTPTPD